jgi:demethylmenaquinone methyltransferase/2-methoxy-6-polyprenyl-1,4-benzoquinol methylase
VFFPASRTARTLQRTYRRLAPLYDPLVPLVSSRARSLGRSWLGVRDGEHVLDAGTGTGLALHPLAAATPTGWTEGVDLSHPMLRRAHQRMRDSPHTRYRLRHADVTALPHPDDTFDAIFCSYVVDVLSADQAQSALREMRRVLRPSGRLVLVYLTAPQRPSERLWTTLARAVPPLAGGARPVALQRPLRECGFEIDAQTTRTQAGLRSAVTRAIPL